jgi:hypothetical protein
MELKFRTLSGRLMDGDYKFIGECYLRGNTRGSALKTGFHEPYFVADTDFGYNQSLPLYYLHFHQTLQNEPGL